MKTMLNYDEFAKKYFSTARKNLSLQTVTSTNKLAASLKVSYLVWPQYSYEIIKI